ncbi:hypothetical protein CDCA_CDCA11G3227 [Cyanidium caldarium]|uniref:J domain-containing protein n=1 Tax=Cyanidium caldarium TaxID=2771 RepID=A0AAV9IY46_CYACA|nr:hypothetical protein CDCA_CDCA11G3227 [Cyanidium caldarium]
MAFLKCPWQGRRTIQRHRRNHSVWSVSADMREYEKFYESQVRQWEEHPCEPGYALGKRIGPEQVPLRTPAPRRIDHLANSVGVAVRYRRRPYYAQSNPWGDVGLAQYRNLRDVLRPGERPAWLEDKTGGWFDGKDEINERMWEKRSRRRWYEMDASGGLHPADLPTDVNLYDILRVSHRASTADIRSAFRRQAKLYHPDTAVHNAHGASDPECVLRFLTVQAAWEILSDPVLRARYDEQMGFRE